MAEVLKVNQEVASSPVVIKAKKDEQHRIGMATLAMCGLPVLVASSLWFVAESLERNANERMVQYVTALTAIAFVLNLIALPATHELSGKKAHSGSWRFYQPGRGGLVFIFLQFASWLLFAIGIIRVMTWAHGFVMSYEYDMRRGLLSSAGVIGILSELLMLLSIKTFKSESMPLNDRVAVLVNSAAAVGRYLRRNAVLSIICNLPFFLLSWVVLPGWLLTFPASLVIYAATFGPYLVFTYRNRPAHTGQRRWEWFRQSWIVRDLIAYFDGDIVKDGELEPGRKYIFAFAPHGIMTLTAIWATLHPKFKQFFPGQDVVPLGASIFQMVPLVRDPPAWVGTRSVSKHSFVNALDEGHSVLVVPGGVKELNHSRSWDNTIRLYTNHKGFVRMAIQQGTDLVPVFSFGETRYFDQLYVPRLSDWLLRTFGMPLPYFIGRGNVLQLPRKTKVTVVYGAPVRVEKNENPTAEQVDEVHRAFYQAVAALFEKYKGAYEHENCKLELIGLHKPPHHGAAKTKQE